MPSRNTLRNDPLARCEGSWRTQARPITRARYDAALRLKQTASLTTASSSPASGGPMKRDRVNSSALRARALGRSWRSSTNWLSRDWRNGVSTALRTPSRAAMATISPGPISSLAVSPARISACRASAASTMISSRRLSCRSIQAPANGPTSNCGISAAKVVRPSRATESVSR
ncbi:hypothetical protein D3C77_266010 [compost metagenome]